MSERPIEEVIGWTYEYADCWIDADGDEHGRAEVDDLAAWLDARDAWTWGINRWPNRTSVAYARRTEDGRGWGPFDYTEYYPTILAALTAAVRKVADQ